jgi:cell division transport system permease protein
MSVFAPRRYALGRAFAMVRERPGAFLLGVVLTASALALPLSLASIVWSVRPVLAQLQPAPELSVFVAPRAAPKEVEALKGRLAAMPGVATVTLRPKDAAFAQLVKKSGFTTPPAELGANPLPDVLVAQLTAPVLPEAIESLGATVRGWPLVDAVRSDLDWYRKVRALGRLAWAAVAVFGGVVLVLVALILVGTVRLHAGTRSDEVAVLRLVGASPRFIVRPYAYSATATLLVACGLALVFVYFAHAVLREPVLQLTTLYAAPFALPDPEPAHVLAVLLMAAAFGWIVGAIGARTSIPAR